MAIYDNIRRVASAKNISIRKLERQAGLANGTISKWNQSEPKIFKLRKVAALLEVTLDDLIKIH